MLSREQVQLFFVKNGISDAEDLEIMLDENAFIECGVAKAKARVAIARIP